jgi:hypothetical protein
MKQVYIERSLAQRESILPLGLRNGREETTHRFLDVAARMMGVVHCDSSWLNVPCRRLNESAVATGNLTQSRRSNP